MFMSEVLDVLRTVTWLGSPLLGTRNANAELEKDLQYKCLEWDGYIPSVGAKIAVQAPFVIGCLLFFVCPVMTKWK